MTTFTDAISWKRALGITQYRQQVARKTGVLTSKASVECKVGTISVKSIFGRK